MFLKCQNFYTLGVEEYFTKSGYFTWRVSDCEELVGVSLRGWWGWDANQCFQKQEKYFWPWDGCL